MLTEDNSRESKRSGRGSLFLRIGISVLLLFFIFRKFQWGQLAIEFAAASPSWLAAAGVLFAGAVALSGIRWWLILRGQGVRLGLRDLLSIVWIGQFFNIFLLGSTGGDLVRVYYIIREAPQAKAKAGTSILLDRVMGMVILAVAAMGAVFSEWSLFSGKPELRNVVWALAAILAASLACCAVLLLVPFGRLCLRWPAAARFAATAEELQGGMRQLVASPLLVGAVLPVSIVVHVLNFAGGYCIVRAPGVGLDYFAAGVVFAIVFFIVAVPISIAGHGLRESAFVMIFSLFGIASTPAVAVSLVYAALTTILSLGGGFVYWAYKTQTQRAVMAVQSLEQAS